MNLDQLKSLQERIRQATGPDRELDCIIQAVFDGRTIREDRDMILARSTRPPYDECVIGSIDPGRKARNFTAAYRKPEVPFYTTDPEGLGACKALQMSVLPGTGWSRDRHGRFWILREVSSDIWVPDYGGTHALETHAWLRAIIAAKIAELEANQTQKVTP